MPRSPRMGSRRRRRLEAKQAFPPKIFLCKPCSRTRAAPREIQEARRIPNADSRKPQHRDCVDSRPISHDARPIGRGPMIGREIENRRSPITNSFPVSRQRIGEGFPQMKIILR